MSQPTSQRDLERQWWADALAAANADRDAARGELEQLRGHAASLAAELISANRRALDAKAEAEHLRAQGLRQQWATRDSGHIDDRCTYAAEAEAFAALYSGEDVVCRWIGDWVAVGGRLAGAEAGEAGDGTRATPAAQAPHAPRDAASGPAPANDPASPTAALSVPCHGSGCGDPDCDFGTERPT